MSRRDLYTATMLPRNDSRSWTLWGSVLAATLVCIIPRVAPDLPTHVVDTALWCKCHITPGCAVITKKVTLDIDNEINSVIDDYAPFLNPRTPLLRLGATELTDPDNTYGTDGSWLEGPGDSLEGWNLALTQRLSLETYFSPRMKESEFHHKGHSQVITAVQMHINIARKRQADVAHSLASPNTSELWVHQVRAEFLQLFSDLQALSPGPEPGPGSAAHDMAENPAAAEAAASEEKQRAAETLCRYMEEGGPWYSVNKEIRSNLVLLRQECVSTAFNLAMHYYYYDLGLNDLIWKYARQRDGPSYKSLIGPNPLPMHHVGLLISAIDDCIAALDAVDNGLLRLRTLLDAQQRRGWQTAGLIYGTRIRTRFELPAPQVIVSSVSERLERVMGKASEMQDTFSHSVAADKSLVYCLREGEDGFKMSRLKHCMRKHTVTILRSDKKTVARAHKKLHEVAIAHGELHEVFRDHERFYKHYMDGYSKHGAKW